MLLFIFAKIFLMDFVRKILFILIILSLVSALTVLMLKSSTSKKEHVKEKITSPPHPRIYFTKDDLERLRKRCDQDPFKKEFEDMLKFADNSIGKGPFKNGWANAKYLRLYAFLYAITGEVKYANEAKKYMDWFVSTWRDLDVFQIAEGIESVAEGYDWCYNALTASERKKYGSALLEMCTWMKEKAWRHSDYCNHVYFEKLRILYGAIALYKEGIDDGLVEVYLKYCESLLKNHLIPASNKVAGDDGGWCEGVGYEKMTAPYLAMAIEAWRVFTGENLFPNSTFLRTLAIWNIYCIRPDWKYVKIHDTKTYDVRYVSFNRPYMVLLASRYKDPYAQWLVNMRPYKEGEWTGENLLKLYDILWYDPNITEARPDTLPLSKHFKGLGWVIMRSGWSENDTYALFECGKYYAGHQHLDQGNFIILGKGGYLVIDSGYYDSWGSPHHKNYYRRTIAHNTIIIYDPEESFDSLSNDGGQMLIDPPRFVDEPIPEPGKIIQYEDKGIYVCVVGDATKAYSYRKLRRFIRTFIFIRPDTFIVYDIVDVPKGRYEELDVKWLLHSINEPKVFGKIVKEESGRTIYEGNSFLVYHNTGELLGYVLFPNNAIIHKVGGPGHEFEVEGINYAPTKEDEETGAWRLELSDKERKQSYRFLVILHVRERGSKSKVNATIIAEDCVLGAKLIEDEDKMIYVLFSYNGSHTRISIPLDHLYRSLVKDDPVRIRLSPRGRYYLDLDFTLYRILVLERVPIDVLNMNGDVTLQILSFSQNNITFRLDGVGNVTLLITSLNKSSHYGFYMRRGDKWSLLQTYQTDEKGSLILDIAVNGPSEYSLIAS
ncbi:MAG: hypothetical protein DRZ82_01450 [Thermoprotei archaeon]|nr:MAG: hypothetical protein DRZ82_01450 [Thermoprotei archaeon]